MKVEAHSPEWHKARCGVFTASRLYDLINQPKSKPRPYIIEVATEALTGVPQDGDYVSEDMAHGVEHEAMAIRTYMKAKKRTATEESYFIKHHSLNFGCTTDRNVYNEFGMLIIAEVKCPKTKTHVRNCLMKTVADLKKHHPKYYWQIVGGAIVHQANVGAFISFDPRVDPNYMLYVLEFVIPEEDLNQAEEAIRKAEQEMQEIINTLNPAA